MADTVNQTEEIEVAQTLWIIRRMAPKYVKSFHMGREGITYLSWWAVGPTASSDHFTFGDQQSIHDAMAWSVFTMYWPALGLFALIGTSDGPPWSPINERSDLQKYVHHEKSGVL